MISGKKIIFFELNEVPFRILDHFCHLMPGSNLSRLRRRARAYETVAEDSGQLSPWITWPSLHRGVSNDVHEITDFGADLTAVDAEVPPVWRLLSKAGVKVGMFGSLHSYPMPEDLSNYAFYVPDTFAAGPECFPGRYRAFQDFNLKMSERNGRSVNRSIALKEAAHFLAAAPRLGMRGRTAAQLTKQLLSEKINRKRIVRRRTSQVQIAFDFYLNALKKERPDISFFFTNHVASSMHRYWPAIFPEDYADLIFDAAWIAEWQDEIPFTMREVDHQLGQLMKFVERNNEFSLVVATSMGQAAVEGRQKVERTIVVKKLDRLMATIGMEPSEWERRPAMVPQYNVAVSESASEKFRARIGNLVVNGKKFKIKDLGSNVFSLSIYLPNRERIEVELGNKQLEPECTGLQNLELHDAASSNAYHIPQGMLMVYDPSDGRRVPSDKPVAVSTLDIAPSLLQNFGIERPSYMKAAQRF